MDYSALWAEIQANPACAEFIHDNEMPKISGAEALAKDQAIADLINAESAPKIVSKEIGDGLVSLALGVPSGPVFLLQLEMLAETAITQEMTTEQIAQLAVARQAWRSLNKAAFDVGNPDVRTGLDMFVGSLLTQEQAEAVKALAEVPNTVTAADVSRAVRGPRE